MVSSLCFHTRQGSSRQLCGLLPIRAPSPHEPPTLTILSNQASKGFIFRYHTMEGWSISVWIWGSGDSSVHILTHHSLLSIASTSESHAGVPDWSFLSLESWVSSREYTGRAFPMFTQGSVKDYVRMGIRSLNVSPHHSKKFKSILFILHNNPREQSYPLLFTDAVQRDRTKKWHS